MNEDPGGVAPKMFHGAAMQLPALVPAIPAKQPALRARRLRRFASSGEMAAVLKPEMPVHILRPAVIQRMAKEFLRQFPGDVMFAVKTNPDPHVLSWLYQAGIRHFDAASIAEVRQVASRFADAEIYFMHPVKSREAIAEAYFEHGVRHFALDSHEELKKLLSVTGNADDLALHVRLSIPNDKAAYALSGKFGVALEEAPSLIAASRKAARFFGLTFHVGSQCMDPEAYATTLGYVRDLLSQVDVRLDMLDVGGGFPSAYPGMTPPPLSQYMEAIRRGLASLTLPSGCRILCEPGRALVAEGGSTVVRVELRKGNRLYLNDGAFGSLFDAVHTEFRYPVRALRATGALKEKAADFQLFGPTCDSMDALKGVYALPADIAEGDWIEIGQLGAYGATMRTGFNGFGQSLTVETTDEPLLRAEL